jgi:aspartyl-tRNA(Asn)/glutamyl-tRNA(Gln) amidotransferase subunit B
VIAYEPVIGLEVHVQLATRTKLFCADRIEFGAPPNTHVCPVCLGLPGALPVLNRAAIDLAIRAALGLACTIHETSVFARKNYFYPDLPKGYQITQFDQPLATGGVVVAAVGTPVRIRRIHVEEDAGKSLHDRIPGHTAIDLNRAGTPLIEIVTEPDLTSPEHARSFLLQLKQTLEYLEVSDCDMEKGSLRVDANVSLRPTGSSALGTKTEIKNMNSFSNLERAIDFEIERQTASLQAGDAIVHETLLWDAARAEARPMRSKEESHDYRYFPDPDLPPLIVQTSRVADAASRLPELPSARRARFVAGYNLPDYDTGVLTATRAVADYFEAVAASVSDPKSASNWVMMDVLGWLNRNGRELTEFRIPPAELARLIRSTEDGTLSGSMAKRVFGEMAETGRTVDEIIETHGLVQVRDDDALHAWAAEVVAQHGGEVDRYRAGESRLIGFFMGEVMKRSGGRADPRRTKELLQTLLGS